MPVFFVGCNPHCLRQVVLATCCNDVLNEKSREEPKSPLNYSGKEITHGCVGLTVKKKKIMGYLLRPHGGKDLRTYSGNFFLL